MRARSVFPLLSVCFFVLCLTAFLLAGPGGATLPAWADSLAWSDLHGPAGGPAQALALNPAFPIDPVVLAGGGRDVGHASWAGLGIFRSLDGGLTWADHGGLPAGALLDVAFSPNWVSDGFALAGFWQGAWSTHDRGATWQMLSSIETQAPTFIKAVAVAAPAPSQYTLLAGGPYGGVYQSANEGGTWTYNGGPGAVNRLQFHPLLPSIALAATDTGLWRSADAGLQWTRVTPATAVYDVAFADDGSAVTTFDGSGWRSDDDGLTWQRLGNTTIERLGAVGLSAGGSAIFAAANNTLYRYDVTAGDFVTVTTTPVLNHILRIALSPMFASDQTLLVGTYDGVWRSDDGGQTFVRSAGFAPLSIYSLAAAGGPAADLYAGTEYGLWRRSGSVWSPLNAGINFGGAPPLRNVALSPTYAQDRTLFISVSSSAGLGASIYRSSDRGESWQRLVGAEYIDQVLLSPAFAADRRLYMVHVQRISSSSDGGDTWTVQPFWDFTHTARSLAVSPAFAQDQTLVAAGNGVYRSADGGATWSAALAPPPVSAVDGLGCGAGRITWSQGGRLYLPIYSFEATAPFTRHDQLWSSADKGQTWTQVAAAPDLPIFALAAGPGALGGSTETLYISTFDDNEADERSLAPDLYISRDGGATWLNLGAAPGGPALLTAPAGAADRLWAGSRGVWLLEAGQMPTATPNPVRELLRNRSFEYEGVWRIPLTKYPAAYSLEQPYEGSWSMRAGIVNPADNKFSYSDFSQDVTLPLSTTITLRLQRWPSSGIALGGSAEVVAEDAPGDDALAGATTVEDFYRLLETSAGDLHYILLIQQPSGRLNYLYKGLDNHQAWRQMSFDLSRFAGQSVRLQFGTYNDGKATVAVQYLDVIELQAVAPVGPTPTPTSTVTPGPTDSFHGWFPYIRKGDGTIPPAP